MKEKVKKESFFFKGLSLCLFTFFMIINYSFPFTSDDIYSLYHIQIESFEDILFQITHFGNGRMLGNALVFLLVRNTLFRVFVKSIVMYLLFYLLVKLLKVKDKMLLLMVAILVLFPSVPMFAQVYAWSAGFANYLPPIVLFLFTIIIFRDSTKNSFLTGVILIPAAIAMQLFCENTTLFYCLVTFSIMAYACFIKKKKRVLSVCYFLSAVVGAFTMFIVPMLFADGNNQAGYRGIAGDGKELLALMGENILIFMNVMMDCFIVWAFLSIGALVHLKQKKELCIFGYSVRKLVEGILVFFPVFCLLQFLLSKGPISPIGYELQWFPLLYFGLYLFCVVLVFVEEGKALYRNKICLLLFYTMASALPLLVVFPVRARVFHLSYVGFCVIAIWGLQTFQSKEYHVMKFVLYRICFSVTAALMLVFSVIAFDWIYATGLREKYFSRMMEQKKEEILLPVLPHSALLQADGDSNFWQYRVKALTDRNVVLTFTDWEAWLRDKEPPVK